MFTCTNDFFYFHAGDVNLFGKLMDGVVGVLIGERVDVHFDPGRNCKGKVTELTVSITHPWVKG